MEVDLNTKLRKTLNGGNVTLEITDLESFTLNIIDLLVGYFMTLSVDTLCCVKWYDDT
jgi:hypothetical protein